MAQQRRKELMIKRQQRKMTVLCVAGGFGLIFASILICLLLFDLNPEPEAAPLPVAVSLPYDVNTPFSSADLTGAQLAQLRTDGRISVSDGPRGISIGDSLDTLLSRFPSSPTVKAADPNLTGEQSDDEIILYCAEYFENQNGVMTALPPRGLLTVDSGNVIVTLLAPTSVYPSGTQDNYSSFEHVYCIFTIEPETQTVFSIVLGLSA